MRESAQFYQPEYGLIRPDIVSNSQPIHLEENIHFPYEQVVISKARETASYIPFQLTPNLPAVLQWLEETQTILPILQRKGSYNLEPYQSMDIEPLYNYQTVGETVVSLLQMINETGGLMHVQQYFDGQRINFRHSFAQFARSGEKEWGIQLGKKWMQFPLIQNNRLQELWIHDQSWKKFLEQYSMQIQQPATPEIPFYIPKSEAKTKETALVETLQFIETLNNILADILAQDEQPLGMMLPAQNLLTLSYYVPRKDIPGQSKLFGDKNLVSVPLDQTIHEQKRDFMIQQLHRYLNIIHHAPDDANIQIREGLKLDIETLFKKTLRQIIITKVPDFSYMEKYFVDYDFI